MMKSTEQSTIFVGFPTTSLPKFTPEGSHVHEIEGGSIVLSLPAEMILSSMDESGMSDSFEQWKLSIPITENQPKKQEEKSSSVAGTNTITSIMQKIIAYPVESKSPIETMLFLSDVKNSSVYITIIPTTFIHINHPYHRTKTTDTTQYTFHHYNIVHKEKTHALKAIRSTYHKAGDHNYGQWKTSN